MVGIIDTSRLKIPPEKHELNTAKFFSALGHDVVFLNPSNIPNTHSPDILMDGLEWEIKCPLGKSKRTIEQNFRHAVMQSHNIIFDLRRINVREDLCLAQLKREFESKTYVKKLLVITSAGQLISFLRT